MPFKFSLREVFEYRRQMEETRQREMQQALRQVEYVEGLIQEARERQARYHRELSGLKGPQATVAWQQIYLDYLTALERLIRQSEQHLEQLRAELERRRKMLEYAVRQRRILDELEKEERKQYLLGERRAEARRNDEVAIRNFLNQRSEKTASQTSEA